MKKVVIVTEFIGLNHNSTAYYWSKIAIYLNDFYDLRVICPRNQYTEGFFQDNSLKVTYVKNIGYEKGQLAHRLLGQLKYAASLNWQVFKLVKKRDIVMTGTNPIISLLFTTLLKKIKRFNWVVLCHDIFPDNLVPSGVLNTGGRYYLLNEVFNYVYRAPDSIVAIGRDMSKRLLAKGVKVDRLLVIPNWANHNEIKVTHKTDNPIIQALQWQDKVVFSFFGNIGRLQGVSNLLDGISKVKSADARFIFIGGGEEQGLVTQFIASNPYNNVYHQGEISLQDKDVGLNCCDIALVSLGKGMYGLGVPSKAYFSMAADKPILIIADKGAELALLLDDYHLGWFCESGDSEALANIIDHICAEISGKQFEYSPREILINNFSEKDSLLQFKTLIDQIVL